MADRIRDKEVKQVGKEAEVIKEVNEAEVKEAKVETKETKKEKVYSVCCDFLINSRKPHKFITGEIYPESLLSEILYEVDLKHLLTIKFLKKEK